VGFPVLAFFLVATMFATTPVSVPDPIRLLDWTPLAKNVSAATVAPDGTLWALGTTEAGGSGIAGTSARDPNLLVEETPTGIYKNYQLLFTPFGVTVGPDGDIYVATVEMGDGSLAVQKMTPAGQNTYLLPKDYGLFMAAGPDGAIWSADGGGNVVRLTIDGTFTKYAATTDEEFAPPITAGSDDTIWFIEQPSNKIVRVQLR